MGKPALWNQLTEKGYFEKLNKGTGRADTNAYVPIIVLHKNGGKPWADVEESDSVQNTLKEELDRENYIKLFHSNVHRSVFFRFS